LVDSYKCFSGKCCRHLQTRRLYSCENFTSHTVSRWFSLYTFSTPTAVYHGGFSRDIRIYTIHSITFSESAPSNLSSYSATHPPPSCYRTFRVACCHFSKKGGEETTQKVRHCPL
jgi:hypothetical protein